jgi:antibiotic biosynthesis monooxygenase (ABM) superfamily enzyme
MHSTQALSTVRPAAPAPPSIHVRAIITWLAIFPLVAVGMTAMSPFTIGWHPVLRSLVLTLIVVPLAVYVVVPRLLALHQRLRSKR